MFIPMFFVAAAVAALFAVLSIKMKKARVLFAVLTVIAVLPAGVLGLIAFGGGSLINYPGDPAAAVTGMIDALGAGEYEAADGYVIGSLGFLSEEGEEADRAAVAMLCSNLSAELGEPRYAEFTCTLPVSLTGVGTELWLRGLEQETLSALDEMVQGSPKDEIFNADETAYLDGITEQAYETAYLRMLDRGGDYVRCTRVNVTLCWTPSGWQILMDEALISALEGFDLGDEDCDRFHGDISRRLTARLYNTHADIVANLPLIEKIYKIAKDALMGCVPDPDGFGSTDDPNEVLAVIDRAKELIGDRTLSWSPEIQIKPGSKINYYYDESILVIQWKEFKNWSLATFAEVIVKDGSQIRRCIAGDKYRSFAWETPTQMSQRTNAVLGMSGDFYMFRACGIMVYQGQVYRNTPESLHHLFFTDSGEMLLTKSYEVAGEDAEAFAAEHDVNFSIAFGPVLIENGEKLPMPNYLVGEFYDDYPRAAIGEVDPLHFILMTVGEEGPRENQTVTLPEAQQYIFEKGVHKAYSLDGGKTANMTFNGELTNDPRYREERTMSDIFYFASAIPEEER